MTDASTNGEEPLEDALAQYFASVDRQEPVGISRLIAAFPDCGTELRRFIEAEQQLNRECRNLNSLASRTHIVPSKIGRFSVQRAVGAGAFGVVYLAIDDLLKREVAIKVPLPHVISDDESRRRFEAEASAAARLDHEGIVAVYEADFSGPTPYIASAYCPGPDLGRWLAKRGRPVPWSEAALFMAKLADAVHYAHQAGVYHRDLKPSNVLLMPSESTPEIGDQLSDYSPQLTDFGLAKCSLVSETQTRSSVLLGTPLYMAPEQLESSKVDHPIQADVYSLGCMLYELTAGALPITGDTYAAVLDRLRQERPTPLRQLVPDASKDFEVACHQCLEKNPLARYASAAEFADDLRACVDHRPIAAAKTSLAVNFRYWLTRPQRIVEAGLYTLCVQLLLMMWLTMAVTIALVTNLVDPDAAPRLIVELVAILGLVHLPMALVGWLTMRRKSWAVTAGLVISTINLVVPIVFVSLSFPPFLADIYAKVDASEYTSLTTCALMLLAELGQLFLYIAARVAQKHAEQRIEFTPPLNVMYQR